MASPAAAFLTGLKNPGRRLPPHRRSRSFFSLCEKERLPLFVGKKVFTAPRNKPPRLNNDRLNCAECFRRVLRDKKAGPQFPLLFFASILRGRGNDATSLRAKNIAKSKNPPTARAFGPPAAPENAPRREWVVFAAQPSSLSFVFPRVAPQYLIKIYFYGPETPIFKIGPYRRNESFFKFYVAKGTLCDINSKFDFFTCRKIIVVFY